ncbi:MAG: type I 3-dehydroquinate dehydratase [Cetobacterium sp.]|uniref:type I 3-dehydroquinate dehydratase n=1 Tax=Cetobacterium sp. TaxID=2071632 RepID=UPI003F3C0A79
MIQTVEIKNMKLGEGIPKICIPLVAKTKTEILEYAKNLEGVTLDVVELRIDHFEKVENIEAVIDLLKSLREILKETPILFTFRSLKEGGEKELSIAQYVKLNCEVAKSRLVDLVDVELFSGDEYVKEIIEVAHSEGVKVIMSNHDFFKTPEKNVIIERLVRMQELGTDIAKIAVMPNTLKDVLVLLEATLEMKENYAKVPVVTMSMGGKGVISRVAGEIFGSALTFGAVNKVSAPGQLEAKKLVTILETLHEAL